jgi:hypothetical protein
LEKEQIFKILTLSFSQLHYNTLAGFTDGKLQLIDEDAAFPDGSDTKTKNPPDASGGPNVTHEKKHCPYLFKMHLRGYVL